jgi:hypothetical protein
MTIAATKTGSALCARLSLARRLVNEQVVDFQAMADPEANRRRVAIPQRRGVAAIAGRAVPTPDELAAAIDEDEIVIDSVK